MRVISALLFVVALCGVAVSGQTVLTGSSFNITGAAAPAGTYNEWIFTDSTGASQINPTLNISTTGTTTFYLNFLNSIHPFGFSQVGSGTLPNSTQFEPIFTITSATGTCSTSSTVVQANTTSFVAGTSPCVFTITPSANSIPAGSVAYYRCAVHVGMIGIINFVGAATTAAPVSSSSSSSSTGTTTAPPTNPPGSSTGHSGAVRAELIPGLAIFLAAIVALLA